MKHQIFIKSTESLWEHLSANGLQKSNLLVGEQPWIKFLFTES